jgi:hypothetical protein
MKARFRRESNLCRWRSIVVPFIISCFCAESILFYFFLFSCLQVYHFLYSRKEESSEHCINAQGDLFTLCCEANITPTPGNITVKSDPPSTASFASTESISPEFNSWYSGLSMNSASLITESISSLLLPITVWFCALLF